MIILKINNNRDYEAVSKDGIYANMDGCLEAGDMKSCCMPNMGEALPGVVCPPIYECPRETIVNRYICHEVPHIIPCNTRIINHHIYRHTYMPAYSCCEENVVQNICERRCC